MRETDIAIVGAGLAGSLAATMLGRAGHSVTLIDPSDAYRPDFRCEKLEAAHVETLQGGDAGAQTRNFLEHGKLAEMPGPAEFAALPTKA